jgi:CheY-like chemotaxis protein
MLVISSDRANLQLMTQVLALRGYQSVQTATTGKDGLKQAYAAPPAVVVMDTGLADTCATEVLKSLNENPLTSKVPVIAVSTGAQESQIQAGLKAGFYRYLTKPYKLPDLLVAIDDSLGYNLGINATP